MSVKLVVGLTGGIGSGKSTVAKIFENLGIIVIDADQIAHEIVLPNTLELKNIVDKFGTEILRSDGSLNRMLLRKKVFSDPEAKKWLENLLHPIIIKTMIERAQKADSPYCVLVIPLLFETLPIPIIDRVLVVNAPEALQKERVKQRDRQSEEEIQAIIDYQVSQTERLEKADDVIDNFKTCATLEIEVLKLHQRYLKLSKKKASVHR